MHSVSGREEEEEASGLGDGAGPGPSALGHCVSTDAAPGCWANALIKEL